MSICSKDRKYQDLSMCCKSLENEKNMVKRKIRDKHNSQILNTETTTNKKRKLYVMLSNGNLLLNGWFMAYCV